MSGKKRLTVKNVSQILLKRGLISQEQYEHILVKGEAQAARLQNTQAAGYARRSLQVPDAVSPAEVISSFNLEIPGLGGKVLTEDAITEP